MPKLFEFSNSDHPQQELLPPTLIKHDDVSLRMIGTKASYVSGTQNNRGGETTSHHGNSH